MNALHGADHYRPTHFWPQCDAHSWRTPSSAPGERAAQRPPTSLVHGAATYELGRATQRGVEMTPCGGQAVQVLRTHECAQPVASIASRRWRYECECTSFWIICARARTAVERLGSLDGRTLVGPSGACAPEAQTQTMTVGERSRQGQSWRKVDDVHRGSRRDRPTTSDDSR